MYKQVRDSTPDACHLRAALAEVDRLTADADARLLYSARTALDAAGAPTTSPEGAPVSDGWRVRWVCKRLAEARAALSAALVKGAG